MRAIRPLFLSALVAAACHTVAEPVQHTVIVDAPAELAAMIRERLDIVRWENNPALDLAQLERLHAASEATVREVLAAEGYFRPKIEGTLTRQGGRWVVRYTVTPGDVVYIKDLELVLTGPILGDADYSIRLGRLAADWLLPLGANFRQTDWDAAKRRGLQSLLIDRYPSARIVASRAEIDPENGSAQLSVTYDSGPAFTLGPLRVQGLRRYPQALVERFWRTPVGAPYRQATLLDFQSALQGTPYFSTVRVDVPIDAEQADQVPVRVEVVEAPQQKVAAGLGYGTDRGLRGSLAYSHHNLLGQGWIGTGLIQLERPTQQLALTLQWPPDALAYRDSASYTFVHQDIDAEETWTHTGSLQRMRKLDGIERLWRLQYDQERARTAGTERQRKALVLVHGWQRDRLDRPNDPQRGDRLGWALAGALSGIGSDTSFFKFDVSAAHYRPLGSAGLLYLRGKMGQVWARDRDEVPTDWLFKTGGAGSVRGYGYQALGVRSHGAVVGGRVLAWGSVEYQHRLVPGWRGAVFLDVGNATDRWSDFRVRRGYGVGLRWITPVGLLAFDLARGDDRSRPRLHFSLGVNF